MGTRSSTTSADQCRPDCTGFCRLSRSTGQGALRLPGGVSCHGRRCMLGDVDCLVGAIGVLVELKHRSQDALSRHGTATGAAAASAATEPADAAPLLPARAAAAVTIENIIKYADCLRIESQTAFHSAASACWHQGPAWHFSRVCAASICLRAPMHMFKHTRTI